MTAMPTGGPAFPCVMPGRPTQQTGDGRWILGTEPTHDPGMTLRDWFAGHSPAAPVEAFNAAPERPEEYQFRDERHVTNWDAYYAARIAWEAQVRAIWSFVYADAMIAERNKP